MVTSGKVFSLATSLRATMRNFWLLWVSRLLENAFVIVAVL